MQSFEGRTGKKRLGAAMVGSFGLLAGLMAALLSGNIAIANVSTAFDLPFQVQVASLTGNGLEQYGWFLNGTPSGATNQPVVESYLHSATLTGLTQTFCVPVPALPFGPVLPAAGHKFLFELQVKADASGTGILADLAGQSSVTLNGLQANVPMGGSVTGPLVTPVPQDANLAGSPATYADTVTNASPGTPVTQYIKYQYAQSLTLNNPSFKAAILTYPGANALPRDCDWQAHNLGIPGY